MNEINEMLEVLKIKGTNGLINIISALLFTLLALYIAKFVKNLIIKGGKKGKLPNKMVKFHMAKDEQGGLKLLETLALLVYVLVLMLMLTPVFTALGMKNVADPISGMISLTLNFIPNIIGAGLILFIGFLIAKVIKEIIINLGTSFKLDNITKKIKALKDEYPITNTIANIAYVLMIIPVVITALETLKLYVISKPAINVINVVFEFVPNIIVCLVIISVGAFLAKIVGDLVKNLINAFKFEEKIKCEQLNKMLGGKKIGDVVAIIVKAFIMIVFVMEAINLLKLAVLSSIANAFLGYLPSLISAMLILIIAHTIASMLAPIIEKLATKVIAIIFKAAVYTFAVFMVLSQLAIAPQIVTIAFICFMGALSVAFIIAAGVGGIDFMKAQFDKLNKKL